MKLEKDEVQHIALLARIAVSDEKAEKLSTELSGILSWVEMLAKADTENVEPMTHSVDVHNVLREDKVKDCSQEVQDALIEAFPEKSDDKRLKVKAVFS